MYTQCPACRTTFKITPAQLVARGGRVRCGICTAIFHAKQRLLQVAPQASPPPLTAPAEVSTKKTKRKRVGQFRRATLVWPVGAGADLPVVTELSGLGEARSPGRPVLWGLGNLLLLTVLAGHFVFFYRDELATIPSWRPLVTEFCHHAGCKIRPRRDIALIEQLQTTIAPHPKYENALRIRTTLVNRASFSQAYPWLEVSLTNNAGTVLARRAFTPAQYQETPATGELTPNVVAAALLDVTNPDGKAVGYEIRLVTP
jgi:predicted Zn finger-like uncharacterized protein